MYALESLLLLLVLSDTVVLVRYCFVVYQFSQYDFVVYQFLRYCPAGFSFIYTVLFLLVYIHGKF